VGVPSAAQGTQPPEAGASPLRQLKLLLSPRAQGFRNLLVRGEQRRLYIGLGVIGFLFWLGIFISVYFLVGKFLDIEGFGPFLARKLMEMLLASLFVMLTFSNIITALSTFYLSDDLELVLSLPISRPTFHYARFLDTLTQSSWMMALFGVPVFLAYGMRSEAGPGFYAALLFAVPALLMLATNIGITVSTLLVNVFPARRTRELMVLLAMMMLAGLFVLLRTLRPERLVNAQEFENAAAYIAQLSVPAPALFPPRWASEIISSTLLYSPFPYTEAALLMTGLLASTAIARWTTAWGFDNGWSRSQEARSARFYRSTVFDAVSSVLPRAWRPHFSKELRVFARDPAQWSQVFLLMGVCGVYLVSIHALPFEAFQGELLAFMKQAMSFLNLGMGGFVMAAIAARFNFAAVSREGRAFWLVRSGPVDPATMLRAKSVLGLVPMLIVGQVVTVGSGLMLDAPGWLLAIESLTTLFLGYAMSGLAVSLGALWPDFRADTAARAATGPAAVFFMVLALTLDFVVLALEIIGFYAGYRELYGLAALAAASVIALCVFIGTWPVARSARALWERGI
jgi:ABC-2 type transport system permease protein